MLRVGFIFPSFVYLSDQSSASEPGNFCCLHTQLRRTRASRGQITILNSHSSPKEDPISTSFSLYIASDLVLGTRHPPEGRAYLQKSSSYNKIMYNMIACSMWPGEPLKRYTLDVGKYNVTFMEDKGLDKHQVQFVAGRIFCQEQVIYLLTTCIGEIYITYSLMRR